MGAGVQLKGNLSRWSVPLDHITESLSRKLDTQPIDLYGFAHYSTAPESHPLLVGSATFAAGPIDSLALQWSGTGTNAGWHPDLASFVRAADAVFSAGTTGAGRIQVDTNGKMVVRQQGSNASPRWFSARAAWDVEVLRDYRVDDDTTPAAWVSTTAPRGVHPASTGWVKIPSAVDFARIPATLSWSYTTTDRAIGNAVVSLVAETRGGAGFVATVLERDATGQRVRVLPADSRDPLCEAHRGQTRVVSRVWCRRRPARRRRGHRRAYGQDLYQSAVDWDHLERAFSGAPSGDSLSSGSTASPPTRTLSSRS